MPQSIREQWKPENEFRIKDLKPEDWANSGKLFEKQLEVVGEIHRTMVNGHGASLVPALPGAYDSRLASFQSVSINKPASEFRRRYLTLLVATEEAISESGDDIIRAVAEHGR